jgi:hypothetical protein
MAVPLGDEVFRLSRIEQAINRVRAHLGDVRLTEESCIRKAVSERSLNTIRVGLEDAIA